jgi:hypothetical protein
MGHPLTMFSIALLLLNDHVFKVIAPSWLTGKLSDFAGLFFFPVLVIAALSLLFGKSGAPSRVLAAVGFGLVGIWFLLLKTYPPVHAGSTAVISALLGHPVVLMRDWTDVFALVMLWPAWRLWVGPVEVRRRRSAYVVLAIGAIAVMATSPLAWTVTSVTDLVYSDDDVLYAVDRETFGKDSYPIAKSMDGGLTWEADFEHENLEQLGDKIFPILKCPSRRSEPGPKECYRVTADRKLEIRYSNTWYEVFSTGDISIRARDLQIIPHGDREILLVAIGQGGILRKEFPEGNWEIIEVDVEGAP